MTLKESRERLQAKQDELGAYFAERKSPDGTLRALSPEEIKTIRDRNDELTEMSKAHEALREVEEVQKSLADRAQRLAAETRVPFPADPSDPASRIIKPKSLGELVGEHAALKGWKPGAGRRTTMEIDGVDLKTLMETAAGFAPANDRTNIVVMSAQRRPVVADLIPQVSTALSVISYMEETTFTNSSDTVLEGGSKPESALAFTERSSNVRKIATYLPVTDEQISDVPSIRAIIDNRLLLMLALTEEVQLLTGNGTAPDLDGFLNRSGVQSQAKGSDTVPDAVYKAMTLVRFTGFAEPSGAIFHPNDWQDIRLLKDSAGNYIWGSPSEAGPERIWGLNVVVTTAETENTALVGDFRMYSNISRRMGMTVDVGWINDDFIKNRQVVRAEERLSLEIYRPAAFAKITGI